MSGAPAGRLERLGPRTAALSFLPALVTAAAVALWTASLGSVDLDRISSLGLITAFGPGSFMALGLVVAAFCWSLKAAVLRPPVLAAHVLALLFMIHGAASAVEPVPRFVTAWLHVGFIDAIARTGDTFTAIDGRFNWPGFLAASAMLTRIAGLQDPAWLLRWAPLGFNLLYLLPLHVITRSLTSNERARWVALWLFVLGNWIGQDYYSPQAFGYFLFLVIFAVLLRYFDIAPLAEADRWQRGVLVAAVVLLFGGLVVSHPLTPLFVVAGAGVLMVFRRTRLPGLPVLLGVIAAAWFSYGAVEFWSGHLDGLIGQVGNIDQAVQASIVARLQGNPGRLIVQGARAGMTLLFGLFAAVGLLRRRPLERHDWNLALLAAVPFPLLALQNYGGELLLRATLFALPFLVGLGALAFFPGRGRGTGSWQATVGVAAVSLVLAPGFLIARYGNEAFERVAPGELAALEFIYDQAEPGDTIVTVVPYNALWRYRGLEQYDYRPLYEDSGTILSDVGQIRDVIAAGGPGRAYVAVTETQGAYVESTGGDPGWSEDLARRIEQAGDFQVAYENADAVVFVLNAGAAS